MDTREKVVGLTQARTLLANDYWTVVVGLFDPLTASQARRIESYKGTGKMLLVALEDQDALLPVTARCHLVAALRSVDYVLSADEYDWRSVLTHNESVRIINDLQEEKQRSREFIELIAARQSH